MERRYTVYIDANGQTTLTFLNGSVTLSSVQAAVLGLSNADYLNYLEATLSQNGGPSPSAVQYQGVVDYALLQYACASGEITTVKIPAPHSGIFLADQQTVDIAAISTLNAAVIAAVVSQSGSPATSYLSGTRRRRNNQPQ